MAALNRLEQSYKDPKVTAEELYQHYDGGDIIPIYTPQQFAKVGSGEEVWVAETGKFYTFSIDKTYMFYGVPEDLELLLSTLKEEIKNELKIELGTGDPSKVQVGVLTLTKETNQLVNSLTITATAESENEIITYIPPDNNETTYTSGTTSINETYTITSNGTYTFSVVEGNGEISDATIVISNIVGEDIQMSLSTTDWTTQNVDVTVTWPDGSAKGIKEIKIANGNWTRYTGTTSVVTVSENCTVYARVTAGTNEMKTNSITIDKIDKKDPTVTVKSVASAMLDERTSGNISEYFTYDKNGIAPITKVEYKTNGVTVDGTTTRALGGTITCTVTKANGVTISKSQNINYAVGGNATEVANNAEIYYGREITNYTPPNGDPDINWRIYYADKEDNKIYLISNRCVNPWLYIPMGSEAGMFDLNGSCITFANIVDNYAGSASITDARIKKLISWVNSYPTSTNVSIRAVAYLLDTELWNEYYKNTTYGDFAIGGPTLELFCKSYKDTHPIWYAEYLIVKDGYYVKWREYDEWESSLTLEENSYSQVFRNNDIYLYAKLDEVNGYWIAGMNDFALLYCVSENYLGYSSLLGIRPIVCLQAGVQVVSNGDGTYALSK